MRADEEISPCFAGEEKTLKKDEEAVQFNIKHERVDISDRSSRVLSALSVLKLNSSADKASSIAVGKRDKFLIDKLH